MVIFYNHHFLSSRHWFLFLFYPEFCSLFAVNSYDWLVNGTAQARVEQSMEEERSFDEYIKVTNQNM